MEVLTVILNQPILNALNINLDLALEAQESFEEKQVKKSPA